MTWHAANQRRNVSRGIEEFDMEKHGKVVDFVRIKVGMIGYLVLAAGRYVWSHEQTTKSCGMRSIVKQTAWLAEAWFAGQVIHRLHLPWQVNIMWIEFGLWLTLTILHSHSLKRRAGVRRTGEKERRDRQTDREKIRGGGGGGGGGEIGRPVQSRCKRAKLTRVNVVEILCCIDPSETGTWETEFGCGLDLCLYVHLLWEWVLCSWTALVGAHEC